MIFNQIANGAAGSIAIMMGDKQIYPRVPTYTNSSSSSDDEDTPSGSDDITSKIAGTFSNDYDDTENTTYTMKAYYWGDEYENTETDDEQEALLTTLANNISTICKTYYRYVGTDTVGTLDEINEGIEGYTWIVDSQFVVDDPYNSPWEGNPLDGSSCLIYEYDETTNEWTCINNRDEVFKHDKVYAFMCGVKDVEIYVLIAQQYVEESEDEELEDE